MRNIVSLKTMRSRIALILALAFLPAGVIAAQSGWSAVSAEWASTQQARAALNLKSLGGAREQVAKLREVSRALSASAELSKGATGESCARAAATVASDFSFAIVSVLNGDGRVVCASDRSAVGRSSASASLIAETKATGDVAIDIVAAPFILGRPVVAALVAIKGDSERYVAVAEYLNVLLADVGAGARDEFTAVVSAGDDAGVIVAGDTTAPADAALLRQIGKRSEIDNEVLTRGAEFKGRWVLVSPLVDGRYYLVRGWTPRWRSGADALYAAWLLLAPIFLWVAAISAAWIAVEIYFSRPLVVVERLARAYANGENTEGDERLLSAASVEVSSLRGALANLFDAVREREARLGVALREERALLKEVNHRVKNNLQMVASILSIQSRNASDAAEAKGLARAQERIQLLALAHSRIYASGTVQCIPLDQLCVDIGRTLLVARGTAGVHIVIEYVVDPIEALADQAVPYAFLVGETLAEFLDEYAGQSANLKMSLTKNAHLQTVFELSGPPASTNLRTTAFTTQRLVDAFATQLDAKVTRSPADGLWIRIITDQFATSEQELV